MDKLTQTIEKYNTRCCAFSQLSMNDLTTPEEIEKVLAQLKRLKPYNWYKTPTGWGETTFFTMVSPGENILEKNLKEAGFILMTTLERRTGYPSTGDIKMYIIKI